MNQRLVFVGAADGGGCASTAGTKIYSAISDHNCELAPYANCCIYCFVR